MVTRVRLEAQGESAAEVERHLIAVASAISDMIGEGDEVDLGGMVIERQEREPRGNTAFSGRGLLYLNVAHDAPQVGWLMHNTGSCSTWPGYPPDDEPDDSETVDEMVKRTAKSRLRRAEEG